jgi:flavin-binding protein dodecin
MAKIVKVIELLAESEKSWEDAVRTALEQARKTLRHIRSIYVEDFEAIVTAGEIQAYRVNAKISFDLEADESEAELKPSGRKSALSGSLESPITE